MRTPELVISSEPTPGDVQFEVVAVVDDHPHGHKNMLPRKQGS
jgi:hypothetical protein